MATILKPAEREFEETSGKIDNYRIWTDVSRIKKGIDPQYLNFDLRRLDPGKFSPPYHSHRYAEELFMILSGTATLRTPKGLDVVESGDLIFMESGDSGAHQLYNHSQEPCVFLDIRSSIGYDVCDYPDSNKVLLAPSMEIFAKEPAPEYFDGEEDILKRWENIMKQRK
ncbi:cupin domain-containing protein [uncultured Alistipes sp.]|jgi:auxin-binding protein|uniref:cupin domain-containing protein n=1 Tax=uncultured Alistipes sp. TaxID=538949 RepID=UPI0025D029D7|nr:cupin domain-containing protein [uncultured Alistipes sp.]